MNISRDNYESFFILYVDKELSAQDCTSVEKFVELNPDLKAELDSFMETTLPQEEMVFKTKDFLYKTALNTDMQEQMLLQLDNELSAEEAHSLEVQIASDASLRHEWNILQKTKLSADEEVVFINKPSLYRHERQRVITMRFWRIAAAAAILGIILFVGISKNVKPPAADNVQVNTPATIPGKTLPTQKIINQNSAVTEQQEIATNTDDQKSLEKQPVNKNLVRKEANENRMTAATGLSSQTKINQAKDEMQATQKSIPVIAAPNLSASLANERPKNNYNKSNEITLSGVKDNIISVDKKSPVVVSSKALVADLPYDESTKMADGTLAAIPNSYAKNTLLENTDMEVNNDHVFLISAEKINRSKVSGLFRKVTRVLTRNANIETGKSITIAGFEVATR